MKFKINLKRKYKRIDPKTLTESDDLSFKLIRSDLVDGWESIIIKKQNPDFPWAFSTPGNSRKITDSSFKLEYLTTGDRQFYIVEPEE